MMGELLGMQRKGVRLSLSGMAVGILLLLQCQEVGLGLIGCQTDGGRDDGEGWVWLRRVGRRGIEVVRRVGEGVRRRRLFVALSSIVDLSPHDTSSVSMLTRTPHPLDPISPLPVALV